MGLPTYEYPPSTYPMSVKYSDEGQCTQCGFKYILKDDGFVCKLCSCRMHAGVQVNRRIYFHGDINSNKINESTDSIKEHLTKKYQKNNSKNLISIYVYPPKKFPMKPIYLKRNGICVHCKNKINNSDKSSQCSKCKIRFCCGVEFKNIVYYHGRILYNGENRTDTDVDLSMVLDSDSSIRTGKKLLQRKRCIFSLIIIMIVIIILILILVFVLKRSF